MVEPDRHPAWSEEDGHAIAHDKRPRVVYLEPLTSAEFHLENVERLEPRRRPSRVLVKWSAVIAKALAKRSGE
jgi:hypothetical protein